MQFYRVDISLGTFLTLEMGALYHAPHHRRILVIVDLVIFHTEHAPVRCCMWFGLKIRLEFGSEIEFPIHTL